LLGAAASAEEQLVDFGSRDAVVSAGGLNAANLFLVNPLLDGGEADAQLQGCIAKVEQIVGIRTGTPRGFTLLRHRNEIVQPLQGTVNMLVP
jgi:hypothetical protein